MRAYVSGCLTMIFDQYHGKREGVYTVDLNFFNQMIDSDDKGFPQGLSRDFLSSIPTTATALSHEMPPADCGVESAQECWEFQTVAPLQSAKKRLYDAERERLLRIQLERAKQLLNIYRTASLVITTRLHCALPLSLLRNSSNSCAPAI